MENYLTAEISASAVTSNLGLLKSRLPGETKVCAVVKADCYGHGADLLLGPISRFADCFAVATPNEAIQLRSLGCRKPILLFFSTCGYVDDPEFRQALDELVAQHVTLTVVSPAEVELVAKSAARVGSVAEVNVKVDSGMGRSGAGPHAVAELLHRLRSTPMVKVTGLYTHFATADESDKDVSREQLARFLGAIDAAGGRDGLTLHVANSAAIIDMPEAHLDMVRPGIAMYGYQPSDEMVNRLPLRPALRLTARLMQIKQVPAGSSCGYGLTHTFSRDSRTGLVPIGYGDGYFRCLSNKAVMRVRGKCVPIRGRISMDQTILDLTDCPAAAIGDEVEIISSDPSAPNSAENLARLADTIPYELTCRLGRRVRRVLLQRESGVYSPEAGARANSGTPYKTQGVTRSLKA